MKVEGKLFWYLVPPLMLFFLVYAFWTGWNEWVGAIGLALSAAMVAMIGWYIGVTAKTLPGQRPEDDRYGHIDQISGHYGHFAPYSWWPLWLSLSGSIIFLGVAVGLWVAAFGVILGVWAVCGWVFEYYKGEHAH